MWLETLGLTVHHCCLASCLGKKEGSCQILSPCALLFAPIGFPILSVQDRTTTAKKGNC